MRRKRKNYGGLILFAFLVLLVAAGLVVGASGWLSTGDGGDSSTPVSTSSQQVPAEPYVVGTASIGSTGDLLMHMPLIKAAKQSDGTYDFSSIFSEAKPYFEQFDLMTANLEVTLAGDGRAYSGYPSFNCPDTIVDGAAAGGVDMLLTANNHTYDTGFNGMLRTMQVLKERSMPFIGTRETAEDKLYIVKDINGVKIGMVCYTYSTTTSAGRKALNGNVLKAEAGPLVSTFDYSRLDEFYAEARQVIADMKADGADATMIYVHWGDEYDLTANDREKNMAQEICNMGYDVIVGGHPHVVQPMDTLIGESGNQTVCLYSMGNAVSNQRRQYMDYIKSGHTEDGTIFGVTFQKYSDGRVVISDLTVIPTWVDMKTVNGKRQYRIVPLDINRIDEWEDMVDNLDKAKASYNRTMKLVGEGLNAYRTANGMSEVPTETE